MGTASALRSTQGSHRCPLAHPRVRYDTGVLLLLLSACGGAAVPLAKPPPRPEVAPPAPINQDLREPLYIKDVGFKTPESVLYDARADRYLVSNIDGSPLAVDDQAFISRVRPDGRIEALKWIDSQQPDVALDAPKGMAIVADVLYVADIDKVRKFDRKTGRPLGSIEIAGATFINDLCADGQGNLYVSDSGISAGFKPSGSDAIYKIEKGDKLSVFARDTGLGRPNGLSADGSGVWVATFGSGELYRLTGAGPREEVRRLPKGSLDGLARLGSRLFISSWEASAIYEREGAEFVERISNLPTPSDIGVDDKRQRLLIPLFYDDTLVIYPLE